MEEIANAIFATFLVYVPLELAIFTPAKGHLTDVSEPWRTGLKLLIVYILLFFVCMMSNIIIWTCAYRMMLRFLMGRLWTKWHWRRAADASTLGLICMFFCADCQYPQISVLETDSVWHDNSERLNAAIDGSNELWEKYRLLRKLNREQWLVSNLAGFTLLPGIAGLAIGWIFRGQKISTQRTIRGRLSCARPRHDLERKDGRSNI